MPSIYREMLKAWSDLDLTRCTESVQQILQEPLHGNENIPLNITENTLIHYRIKLVKYIWDLRTNDFREFVGLRTNATFCKLYNDIKANLPRQWIRTLKSDDPHDGETEANLPNGNRQHSDRRTAYDNERIVYGNAKENKQRRIM